MPTSDSSEARETSGWFAGAPVTFVVILANLAIFAGEVIASRSLASLNDVPGHVILAFGADYAPLTLGLGQYERLVTCCFVHAGLLHLGMNMWSLGQIGPFAEKVVGSARFSVLYVVTGVAGSLASLGWGLLKGTQVSSVGASGAICGVLGAALVLGVRLEGWKSSIARQIGFWVVVILVYGAQAATIDNAAHVGGLVSGCITAALWRRGIHYSTRATVLSIAGSAAICIAAGVTLLWRGATDPLTSLGAEGRSDLVERALSRHDCAEARRLLLATEGTGLSAAARNGLRNAVEVECPAPKAPP